MSKIEWTELTVNPIRAGAGRGHYCEKLSPGCKNCYASAFQPRVGMPQFHEHRGSRPDLSFREDVLHKVLRRRTPTTYFWCSMTDLFGAWVPFEWMDRVLATIALTPWHTHILVTKRAKIAHDYFQERDAHVDPWINAAARLLDGMKRAPIRCHAVMFDEDPCGGISSPLPQLQLLFSVEDQPRADERIPWLLRTPVAVRGVSYEPALGPVDFDLYLGELPEDEDGAPYPGRLDWIIVGGESGPGARPCDVEWIRSTVAQCRSAGVACFVKQLGARPYQRMNPVAEVELENFFGGPQPLPEWKLRDRKGADPSEWPEDLRVREFPARLHTTGGN